MGKQIPPVNVVEKTLRNLREIERAALGSVETEDSQQNLRGKV